MAKDFDLTAYLYVLGCKDGPHKVGYSYTPEARVKAMIREGRQEVFVVGKWPVGVIMARAAERYAHWLLRDHHLEHEWFNVSAEAAVAAVKKALEPEVVASYDPYTLIPPVVAPAAKFKNGEYVRSKFPAGTTARIRAVLRDGEQHADLFRDAVKREIERREREGDL